MSQPDGFDILTETADSSMDAFHKMMQPSIDLEEIGSQVHPETYVACFGTPAGQEVLRDLYARYVNVTRMVPGQGSDQGFYREGMAQVVFQIVDTITNATNGEQND